MIQGARRALRRRSDDERGASLVEYALLVALVAVVCIAAVTFVGTSGSDKLNQAGTGMEAEPSCSEYTNSQGLYHRMTIAPHTQGDPIPGPCP